MSLATPNNKSKLGMLFVLVHGTWAPKSPWTQSGDSLLCERLKSTYQNENNRIEIFSPEWSGKNRESHRLAGGTNIANLVRERLNSTDCDDSTDVFFIAHSHGTDVAMKALAEFDEDHRIRGLAAFNSPNILTLKRGFANSIRQFIGFIKIAAFFVLLTTLSMVVMSKFFNMGSNILAANIVFLLTLIATYFVFELCSKFIIGKLNHYSEVSLKRDFRRSLSDRNETPVLVINSSSDEAWNFLNLITSIVQLPFYITHRLIMVSVSLVFFYFLARNSALQSADQLPTEMSFFFDKLSSYGEISRIAGSIQDKVSGLESRMLDETDIWKSWSFWIESKVLSTTWLVGAFSSVVAVALLNTGLLAACAIFIGYFLGLLVESFALGAPRWPTFEFFSTRKCVGLVPLSSKNLSFFDAGIGGSFLDHSLPYNDNRTLNRLTHWITDNCSNQTVKLKKE